MLADYVLMSMAYCTRDLLALLSYYRFKFQILAMLCFFQGKLAERNSKGTQRRFCLRVALEQKQTVLHYQPHKSRTFFKIVVATPNLVAQSRGQLSICQAKITDTDF